MPNIAYVQILNLLISNSLIRACVFQIPTASNQFPILSSPNPYPHYYLQVSMQQTQQFKIYENNYINNFHTYDSTLLHQTVENKLFFFSQSLFHLWQILLFFQNFTFYFFFQAIVLCQLLITTQCCIIIFYLVFFQGVIIISRVSDESENCYTNPIMSSRKKPSKGNNGQHLKLPPA